MYVPLSVTSALRHTLTQSDAIGSHTLIHIGEMAMRPARSHPVAPTAPTQMAKCEGDPLLFWGITEALIFHVKHTISDLCFEAEY